MKIEKISYKVGHTEETLNRLFAETINRLVDAVNTLYTAWDARFYPAEELKPKKTLTELLRAVYLNCPENQYASFNVVTEEAKKSVIEEIASFFGSYSASPAALIQRIKDL